MLKTVPIKTTFQFSEHLVSARSRAAALPGFPGGSSLASPVPLKAPSLVYPSGALGLVVVAGMVGAGPKGLWEDSTLVTVEGGETGVFPV